ncbi:hypothetical protein FB446DRAFT_653542 [Lentinula raphanica]|nr:hypothetical protein FB446DRAFT_653542 [Lentinula raphanica]
MEIQAKIVSALVALHNFILVHDKTDIEHYLAEDITDNFPGFRREAEVDFGMVSTSHRVRPAEKRHAEAMRDRIAHEMWEDYRRVLADRAREAMDVDYDGDIPELD